MMLVKYIFIGFAILMFMGFVYIMTKDWTQDDDEHHFFN